VVRLIAALSEHKARRTDHDGYRPVSYHPYYGKAGDQRTWPLPGGRGPVSCDVFGSRSPTAVKRASGSARRSIGTEHASSVEVTADERIAFERKSERGSRMSRSTLWQRWFDTFHCSSSDRRQQRPGPRRPSRLGIQLLEDRRLLSVAPLGPELDPDDQISEANAVSVAERVIGTISAGDDVDMFTFEVAESQEVSFDVYVRVGNLDAALRLFDATGNELAANEMVVGQEPFLQYTFVSGGNYYLGVSEAGNTDYDPITGESDRVGASVGGYALTILLVESAGPVGEEFKVNSSTEGDQSFSSVAKDADGDFVVVWHGWTPSDPDRGADVFGRLYNAAGEPQGDQFLVNAVTDSTNRAPKVAMDADGDFVVVWQSYSDSNREIFARRYNAAGEPQGDEFLVNTHTAHLQENPRVAMSDDGGFVITWMSQEQDGWGSGIYAQRYHTAGVPQGGEFLVNTTTDGHQHSSSVAMDATGDFIIAWVSGMIGSGESDVYAQRFDAAGVPQGGEFLVNTFTANTQHSPNVAMTADGESVIVWGSQGQDGSDFGIFAQRYDAAGAPQGSEFQVNSYTAGRQEGAVVALDGDAGMVIAWYGVGSGDHAGIYAQRFDSAGAPVGTEFRVNTYIANTEHLPSVAIDPARDFVITWTSADFGRSSGHNGVYAQRFAQPTPFALAAAVLETDPDDQISEALPVSLGERVEGTIADGADVNMVSFTVADSDDLAFDIRVAVSDLDAPVLDAVIRLFDTAGNELAANDNHNGALEPFLEYTFTTGGTYYLGVSAAGNINYDPVTGESDSAGPTSGDYELTIMLVESAGPVGPEFQVHTSTEGDQSFSSVAKAANGDFVIVWHGWTPSDPDRGADVFGRLYNSAGEPQGEQFLVNAVTDSTNGAPKVAMDANGDYVAVWQSYSESNREIFARRYNAAGEPQSDEFQVNTFIAGLQENPHVAMGANGSFVVTWMSYEQDGSDQGVFAQRYDASGAPQGGEFQVNTTTEGLQHSPSVGVDANGDFVIAWVDSGDVYAQAYTAAGEPQGGEFLVNTHTADTQHAPSVAMNGPGDFVIAWNSKGQDGSGWGIYAQAYDASGAPQGDEFRANTYTAGNQSGPAVTLNSRGDFVITWYGVGSGDHAGVYAQRFTSAGAPAGAEFRVNAYIANTEHLPSVAIDAAGDFVIAWTSADFGRGSGHNGVYAQRFGQAGEKQKDLGDVSTAVIIDADAIRILRILDLPPSTELQVVEAGADVPNDTGDVSFDNVELSRPLEKTFTVSDSGQQPLTVDVGSFSLPAGYALVSPPALPTIDPGRSTALVVSLVAVLSGEYAGEISFATDAGEGTFDFNVSSTVLTTQILGNDDPGYAQTGDFQSAPLSIARDGDVGRVVGGAMPSEATWTFTVEPGEYQIASTWFDTVGNVYFADNAPFTAIDGETPTSSASPGELSAASSKSVVAFVPPSQPGGVLRDEALQSRALDDLLATAYWNGELDQVATALAEDTAAREADDLSGDLATAGEVDQSEPEALDLALSDWTD